MSNRTAFPHPRAAMILSGLLVGFSSLARAEISIGIGLPSVSIGINVPVYPTLVPVPGYPVYYDPGLRSNLFFYDGLYWVYAQDNWYTSSWYNGPWDLVEPQMVPDFVLRVPLRFYRRPPAYFRGWDRDRPPRWGEHWGHDWDEHRRGWDHWDRSSIPRRAPLPTYQRQYSRDHYPSFDEQRSLRDRNYRYQPREEVARRHFEEPAAREREQPGRDHQPHSPPHERERRAAGPQDNARQNAPAVERPSNGERRRAPALPSRSTAQGEHSQSDRRPPDGRPPERARPNAPPPESHRGNPPPADHPSAPERRNAPRPRSQPEHRDSQRANPAAPQREGRPEREPGRDAPQRSRSEGDSR